MSFKELKPFSECNVLIVDDEQMSRMLLKTMLDAEFRCNVAQSGKEAISVC